MSLAIEVEGLGKVYRGRSVLSGVSFGVPAGTVLGLLGPNGAGKTTTVRILSTLVKPDSGRASIVGFDVTKQQRDVRRHIGLSGQYAAVDNTLTGEENIVLLARLSKLGRRAARTRAAELLEVFGLTDAARRPVGSYSGGMRRRLDLATCLIGRPPVLFLDEPTTGLDPTSRALLWDMIRAQVAAGVTVLLTTQYLEEADQLANHLLVIDGGQVIADGSPDALKRKVGAERLEISVRPEQMAAALRVLAPIAVGPPTRGGSDDTVSVQLHNGLDGIAMAASALRAAGLEVTGFELRRPSLDDVFFHLTGATTPTEGRQA